MKAPAVFAAVLLAMAGAPAAADTYVRQPGITIAHYTFEIALSDASNELVVSETVEVRILAPGVTTVDLDLCKFTAQPRSPMTPEQFRDPCAEPAGGGRGGPPIAATGGKGMTITAVTADGRPASFQHEKDRVHMRKP